MNVFLLGATGDTGYEVLKLLLQQNHQVTALVRTPSKLDLKNIGSKNANNLDIIQGGVFDNTIENQMKGSDVVISALGTGKDNKYTEVYSEGGRNILEAMRNTGVKRLITITSGLIDMSDPSTDNFFLNRIIRPNFNKVYYDQTRWETVLDDTHDIDWTCVRPTYLVNKKPKGEYRIQNQHCPKGGRKISRADLADFIVKQMESDEYIMKKPVISY